LFPEIEIADHLDANFTAHAQIQGGIQILESSLTKPCYFLPEGL
tara:strand:+ start:5092 stop:5223 length:132 start_codon:yes stop_codon:yes gene_type:complete